MGFSLTIDMAPMADLKRNNHHLLVLNLADDAVVADAVFPKFSEARSGQSLTDGSWIVESFYACVQEVEDAFRNGTV